MDIRKFPANVYKVYKEYINEKNHTRKLSLLFDVFGQIIRFFGCVFLCEYMYSDEVDAKINDSIVGISRPSLGSWFMFIREYARHIYKTKDSFIEEFGDIFINLFKDKNYDKEYTGRFRNPSIKQGNAFDEIIMIRNAIAHGAMSPSEDEAEQIIQVYDQYINRILESFYTIFEKYYVSKVDEVEDNFVSITVYFDIIRYDEKHNERLPIEYSDSDEIMGEYVSDYFTEGQMYLLSDDGRALKLAEYLVDIIDESEHEDYYLYDGYGNSNVVYIGMKFRKHLEQYLTAIKEKFLEKGASTRWNKAFFEYDSFVEYINELASVSIHIHENTGKYNKKVYVERDCDYLLEDFLKSDKTTMIVTADAGVGKTNFLCYSADKLIKQGKGVYFYNGFALTKTESDNIIFHKIQDDCLNSKEFRTTLEFLEFINKENKDKIPLIIFIDAANEAYDMLGVLQEVDTITNLGEKYPWLKIIVSIRTVSFQILKNRITDDYGKKFPLFTIKDRYYSVVRDNRISYEVRIEEWNILQVADAFEKYKIANRIQEESLIFHTMSRDLQILLHNPLNMRLFFMAKMEISDRIIETEDDLYGIIESTWNENTEVTRRTNDLQKSILRQMIDQKKNEINADIVYKLNEKFTSEKINDIRLLLLSPLERLKDSGILYEKDEEGYYVIAFVYQKYLEYLILKGFASENLNSGQVIEKMLESRDWSNLPEMYIACINFLEKDKSDNASKLYSIVVERGLETESFRTVILRLWKKRLLSGHIGEVVDMIRKEGLYDWGLKLAKDLYINEESKACYMLVNDLLENDPPMVSEFLFQRGLYFMKVSRIEEAEEDFKRCIDLSDGDLKNNVTVQLAKNFRKKGDVPKAIEILDKFISSSDEDTPYYPDALIQRGLCAYSDKLYEEALEYYEKALRITDEKKDYYVSVYNMLGMSTVHASMGHLDKCESILMDVLKIANDLGYVDYMADCLNGLSANYVRQGKYKEAISHAKQGLFIWKNSDYYTGQAVMYCTIIKALAMLKRNDDTQEYMDELNKIMPMIKEKVIIERYDEVFRMTGRK